MTLTLIIKNYLSLIFNKLLWLGFFQGHCNTGNSVRVGSSLKAGEDCCIDLLLVIVLYLSAFLIEIRSNPVENQSSSWASQGFVSSCHDDICILKWAFNDTSSHKTRWMGNISMKVGSNLVRNLSELFVIQKSTVSRSTCYNKSWSVNFCHSSQLIVVDKPGFFVQMVWKYLEIFWNSWDFFTHGLESVTQVATVWKVEGHDSVVWIEKTSVNGKVGRWSWKGLNVDAPFLRVEIVKLECSFLA